MQYDMYPFLGYHNLTHQLKYLQLQFKLLVRTFRSEYYILQNSEYYYIITKYQN